MIQIVGEILVFTFGDKQFSLLKNSKNDIDV